MRPGPFALWLLAVVAAAPGWGQPVVAPTAERVGSARGDNVGEYNLVNSWELGYRARGAGGNLGKYRSDVNFGNGIRLLAGEIGVYSRDGRGRYFDELVLSTQGLGNDPYQSATLRIQKNRLYRYDLGWRLNEYFNPALAVSGGQHRIDTSRRWQDHDLTLLPQSPLRLLAGFSRNSQSGPALTTLNVDGAFGDEFPLLADIRRVQNEYRLGGVVEAAGWRWTFIRSWENFKEDTPYRLNGPEAGNNPADRITLGSFRRDEPYHGLTRSWRVSLTSGERRRYGLNGRFTYSGGERAFLADESYTGTDRFAAERNRQLLVFGAGRRPVATGNLTMTILASPRLTVANHTAVYQVRMEGDAVLRQFDNATQTPALVYFQALGIRTLVNTADVNYRPSWRLGLYGGYHYSTRRIRSRQRFAVDPFEDVTTAEQTNRIHSGLAGVRLKPVRPLAINFTGEIGRADRPFYPISERRYQAFGARAQYKTKTLLVSASAGSSYNTNSVALSTHSSRGRNYAAGFSWTPSNRLALDAGYEKLHLDTLSGLAYFAASRLIQGERSIYVSNLHSGHFTLRLALRNRVDLYLGYNRIQDAGDGRAASAVPPAGAPAGSALAAFRAAQTFPLSYQSPLARLSVRIREKLRWNAGYQWYGYAEEFSLLQNYRAHTGYVSLLWSF
jgi:hypothetical protein